LEASKTVGMARYFAWANFLFRGLSTVSILLAAQAFPDTVRCLWCCLFWRGPCRWVDARSLPLSTMQSSLFGATAKGKVGSVSSLLCQLWIARRGKPRIIRRSSVCCEQSKLGRTNLNVPSNVRSGSKPVLTKRKTDFRITHASRHSRGSLACLTRARSGLTH
jgi:hypothetical protein